MPGTETERVTKPHRKTQRNVFDWVPVGVSWSFPARADRRGPLAEAGPGVGRWPGTATLTAKQASRTREHASLILTSNLPVSGRGTVFGDQAVAAAMIDSIVHRADVLTSKAPATGSAHAASTACPAPKPEPEPGRLEPHAGGLIVARHNDLIFGGRRPTAPVSWR
jgi:hypothetical protein